MLLVVDANIIFSALLMRGKPLSVFELNALLNKFELISPEYVFFEIGRRVDKILAYSHFSKEEFIRVFSFIKGEIELIPFDTFRNKLEEAKPKSPHEEDIPYIALSLEFDCKILSGDRELKTCLPDRVITPSEAVEILLGRKPP
ncbi:MAG: hypothetical protein DRQ03_07875 [Candidatus Hydrothermota bacterium]|nr:MAG: hypothetical protein DRQ03_07875 [Candidatus Hydrothermae bacterium]